MADKYAIERKKPDLKRELGLKADPELTQKITSEIASGWGLKENPPSNKAFLLFGGFQASGKTSIITAMKARLPVISISRDEIRHKFLQMGIDPYLDRSIHTINAVRNELITKAVQTGHHVAVDSNSIPLRLDLFTNLVKSNTSGMYKVLTIYLNAPKTILVQRIKSRSPRCQIYNGTVEELEISMKTLGNPDLSRYELVFNTHQQSIQYIANNLHKHILRV